MASVTTQGIAIRALGKDDLDAVVAIDAAIEGRSRGEYIRRRLAAALREPAMHVQLGATQDDGALAGYILARRIEGEFGHSLPALRLELIGVRKQSRHRGVGTQLMDALATYARRHGVAELRTTATWNQHRMLPWLGAVGFTLAPEQILDCAVGDGWQPERNDALDLRASEGRAREVDYGEPEGNDFERSAKARCEVSAMRPEDLPQIVRIDREITGRNREPYIAAKLREAMDDSAIRVSLSARLDGAIVGYLMARADLGDFGRAQPVAVLDTLGVDPAYGHHGVGHALVSQLFANLGALHVDRVETVVAAHDLPLLGFLYGTGFQPSQRLSFVRRL